MAGNARFHNKYHRANHHSTSTPGIPDSASDPIASNLYPFQGNFVINGSLSAKNGFLTNSLTGLSHTFVLNTSTFTFNNGLLTNVVGP